MNLHDQLQWEEELITRGSEAYWKNQDRLRDSSDADKGDAVSFILKERMREVASNIEVRAQLTRGRGANTTKILKQVAQGDYLKLAFIGLQVIFQKTAMKNHNTLLKICLGIGIRIEADLKCQMFQAEYPEYYHTVMKSLKEQRVTDYMHKHKVFMKKFRDFDKLQWVDFEPNVQCQLGLRIVDSILLAFEDVFFIQKKRSGIKTTSYVETTVQFDEWLGDFEKARGLISPARLPLKIPPRPWDSNMDGGYYTPVLSQATQFIKTKSREHEKFTRQYDPAQHRKAVNKMQRTPWSVNQKVLDVQIEVYAKGLGTGIPSNIKIRPRPFPEHLADIEKADLTEDQREEVVAWKVGAKASYGREQDRKASVVAFMQSFKLAKELRNWDKFYYVYTCDFRGRVYCATSGLSPQSNDPAKGLLQFGCSETLGKNGVKWLAIHGANVMGQDKLPFIQRVAWVRNNEEYIRRTVEDPISTREFWGNADKPYQFLAFCFDWANCDYGRNTRAKSALPIGLDGSCNGLQHFSAMLRDQVGARATNLTPTDTPQDIYLEVAMTTEKLIVNIEHPWADKWSKVGITRKVAKRPVMTLPYGARQKSARNAIYDWVSENWQLFELHEKHAWDISKWLTPHLWEAIGETVVAAREAMTWLQKNVGKDYCSWITPIGFPVYQYYKAVPITEVKTMLCGVMKLKLADLDCYGEPKLSRQRSGIAPNFVHGMDSTHMVMTVNRTDFSCYAMIHDDYGTHAGKTEQLAEAIKRSFYKLYSENDPLKAWGEQVGADLSTMPERGEYDILDILKADYFFS